MFCFSNSTVRRIFDVHSYGIHNSSRNNEYDVDSLHKELKSPEIIYQPCNKTCATDLAEHYHKVKFYRIANSEPTDYPWRWPFIDIKFYIVIDWAVINIDHRSQVFQVPREYFYPLTMRPFGPLWLPAPKDTQGYLRKKYHKFTCSKRGWNHRLEKPQAKRRLPCSKLTLEYPFVKRRKDSSTGFVIEELRLGLHITHAIRLNQSYIPTYKYNRL